MKKQLLSLLVITLSLALNSIIVQNTDYGFGHNKQRIFKQGSWIQNNTDLSEGTGKYWEFSLPSTGYVNSIYSHIEGTTAFPTANIVCQYTQHINGYDDAGFMYYLDDGTDILNLGYTGSPYITWTPPIPMGLPHYLGKTWQGTHIYEYGTYTVTGNVISEGTISTHLGTFPALCVRYHYTSSTFSYYYYQWETQEYGITAYTNDLNGGMLYVLEQADPNQVSVQDSSLSPELKLSVYPNPARDKLWIKSSGDVPMRYSLSLYDLRGRLVAVSGDLILSKQAGAYPVDLLRPSLPTGIYFLQIDSAMGIQRLRLVLMR